MPPTLVRHFPAVSHFLLQKLPPSEFDSQAPWPQRPHDEAHFRKMAGLWHF